MKKFLKAIFWLYIAVMLLVNSIIIGYIAWVLAMLNNIFG